VTLSLFLPKISATPGIAMLVALIVRIFLRLRSGIPPRFPGHPIVQMVSRRWKVVLISRERVGEFEAKKKLGITIENTRPRNSVM